MSDPKMCPLLAMGWSAYTGPSGQGGGGADWAPEDAHEQQVKCVCVREACAWWDDAGSGCAIAMLAHWGNSIDTTLTDHLYPR